MTIKSRILKACPNSNGYYGVQLSKLGICTWYKTYKLVSDAFLLNPETKLEVNHIDGNKANNHLNNLERATRSENQLHAYKLGLNYTPKKQGEDNHSTKLNNNLVLTIRMVYAFGQFTQAELGRLYGISNSLVHSIVHRKTWSHI